MESQERDHRPEEVLDVFRLGLFTAASVSRFPFGVPIGGSFYFEFSTNAIDGRRRCPNAPGEDLPASLLGDAPMIAHSLHSAGEGGITGRKQHPAFRHG